MIRSLPRSATILAALLFATCALASLARANPPFTTDDPGVFPVDTGEAYLFSAGTRAAGGLGLGAAPGMEVNFSLMSGTFFHVVLPMAYNDPAGGPSAYGPGDAELGFKWQFLDQADDGIDVATFPLAEVPMGGADRGLGSKRPSYFLPLWLERDWGPWTVYGGGGRWFMHDPGQRDWWYSGVLVQRQLDPDLYLGGEVFHETPRVLGGPSATGFNLGGATSWTAPGRCCSPPAATSPTWPTTVFPTTWRCIARSDAAGGRHTGPAKAWFESRKPVHCPSSPTRGVGGMTRLYRIVP